MRKKVTAAAVATLAAATMVLAMAGPAPAGDVATITVTKVVSGPEPAGASYVVNVSCIGSGGSSGVNPNASFNFPAGGGTTQFGMVVFGYQGDCTFVESTTSGATPSYACSATQPLAATCGGGGASPSTLNVNNPVGVPLATITVTNTFAEEVADVPVVEAAPSGLTG